MFPTKLPYRTKVGGRVKKEMEKGGREEKPCPPLALPLHSFFFALIPPFRQTHAETLVVQAKSTII